MTLKDLCRPGDQADEPLDGVPRPAASTAERRRLAIEGLWVAGGHFLAAVATLAGVRLITEVAQPSIYGAFILANGILALVQGAALQPMAQAALRHYPDFAAAGSVAALHAHLKATYLRRWVWSLPLFGLGAVLDKALLGSQFGAPVWALLAFGLAAESWKAIALVMRNAARAQRQYAMLTAADSVARPAGAVLAAWSAGASLETLLLGQIVGSLLVLLMLAQPAPRRNGSGDAAAHQSASRSDLMERMARFAAPLVWLPVVGWVAAQADRYLVGSMLGVAQAGIYAAAYGLASRPLLMLGTITEATLRQPLYGAVSHQDTGGVRRVMAIWLGINVCAGVALVLAITLGSQPLVRLLLAEPYRTAAAQLLPWISAGYLVALANQAVERLLYAQGYTGRVTAVQAVSALNAVVLAALGSQLRGLVGVAAAVSLAFTIQLLMNLLVARHLRRVQQRS